MKTFRLIRSQPSSAVYNMALDENIFARFLDDRVPVFRVYRWRTPSFTYGVGIDPARSLLMDACASDGVEVVKRMTGGGVLFHHDEITYSFVCVKDDIGEPQEILVSYRAICAFLIRFYASLGLVASFACNEKDFKERSAAHYLCSAAHEKYDIVINGRKIGGNAQKRRKQAIFQHGSVPCRIEWNVMRSYCRQFPRELSAQATSLSEELAVVPDKKVLEQKLIEAFSEVFGVTFIEDREFANEACMAQ